MRTPRPEIQKKILEEIHAQTRTRLRSRTINRKNATDTKEILNHQQNRINGRLPHTAPQAYEKCKNIQETKRKLTPSTTMKRMYPEKETLNDDHACIPALNDADQYTASLSKSTQQNIRTNMTKVSVIVPVYNIEKQLPRCINSILQQTYYNIELILINDGSNDNSGIICDKYAKRDKRIKVIHQQNGGVSIARNNGINCASGDFICFVDGDDYIENNEIELCVKAAEKDNSDIVIFDYFRIEDSKRNLVELNKEYIGTKENIYKGIILDEIQNYVWNKIYRKNIWENLRFTENACFEDLIIMPLAIGKAKRITYLNKALYNYDCNTPDSITKNISAKNKFGKFIAWNMRSELALEENDKKLSIKFRRLAYRSAVTSIGLDSVRKELTKSQKNTIYEFLKNEGKCIEYNPGLKYKLLYTGCIKRNIILKIYGYSVYIIEKIKKAFQL